MQRGRQKKYSWEEDSRFQPANDDHDEEWPRVETARPVARRSGSGRKARRPRKSPFLAALQGASMAIFAVLVLGAGGMYAIGISPADLGLGSSDPSPVKTASLGSTPAPVEQAAASDEAAPPPSGDAFAASTAADEPIRQPVAVRPASAELPTEVSAAVEPAAEASEPAVVKAPIAPEVAAAPPAPPPEPEEERLQLSESELNVLLTRAAKSIEQGDVSAARLLLARAAKTGDPKSIMLLGQTYDPNMLDAWGNRGVKPNPEKARALYKEAQELGSDEAGTLLSRLN